MLRPPRGNPTTAQPTVCLANGIGVHAARLNNHAPRLSSRWHFSARQRRPLPVQPHWERTLCATQAFTTASGRPPRSSKHPKCIVAECFIATHEFHAAKSANPSPPLGTLHVRFMLTGGLLATCPNMLHSQGGTTGETTSAVGAMRVRRTIIPCCK